MSRAKKKLPKLVFLSHEHRDRRFVEKVASLLKAQGIKYWYSRSHIGGAQQWQDEIGHALNRCDWFLVVLSPRSVKSKWVRREVAYALDKNRYEDKIIPVLYKVCQWKKRFWPLTVIEFIDFTGKFDHGCQNLLKIWKIRQN